MNRTVTDTITRTYDGLDRLTQEVTAQGTVNYTYDNASRRATMTVVGQTQVVYTYDNANRLTNIQQGTSTIVIGYDDADRRTSVTYPKEKGDRLLFRWRVPGAAACPECGFQTEPGGDARLPSDGSKRLLPIDARTKPREVLIEYKTV